MGFKIIIIKDYKKYVVAVLVMIFLSFLVVFVILLLYIDVSNNATVQFAGKGFSVLIPALIFSFIKTGLAEEIFFRGFLTKRLISKFEFKIGNIVQGLIFGLLHGILFFGIAGALGAIVIITLTGISGWLSGWINEKQSGGSIISSWLLHGIGNIIASIAAVFNFI